MRDNAILPILSLTIKTNTLMKIRDTYCTLGKDAVYTISEKGTPITKVTAAVSNDYKNKETDEWVKRPPHWYNLIFFGAVADEAMTLLRGDRIKIEEAKYERSTYKNKDDEWRESNDVIVYKYELQERREN